MALLALLWVVDFALISIFSSLFADSFLLLRELFALRAVFWLPIHLFLLSLLLRLYSLLVFFFFFLLFLWLLLLLLLFFKVNFFLNQKNFTEGFAIMLPTFANASSFFLVSFEDDCCCFTSFVAILDFYWGGVLYIYAAFFKNLKIPKIAKNLNLTKFQNFQNSKISIIPFILQQTSQISVYLKIEYFRKLQRFHIFPKFLKFLKFLKFKNSSYSILLTTN